MRDISNKTSTLRTAVAQAVVHVSKGTVERIAEGTVPKGDPLPVARVAAIQAAKQTSSIIPFCHPIPIDHADCSFELKPDRIEVSATVTAIHKTGVEMEALTAASVAALTLYDMLKPIDEGLSISGVRLVSKTGGKSDHPAPAKGLKTAVVVLSDSAAAGQRQDTSGKHIVERLKAHGVDDVAYHILPDDPHQLKDLLKKLADARAADIIFTSGGTGIGPRDITPEATRDVLDHEVPGIAETIRGHGQDRLPTAMLSRNTAGVRGKTLIVNLPGSLKGVKEGLDAILSGIFHAAHVIRGGDHDAGKR